MLLTVVVIAANVLAIAGCGSDDTGNGEAADPDSVVMKDIQFVPDTITVTAGSKVTWTNEDPVDHTVTADDGSFDSGNLGEGESFSYTFDSPGTYDYSCELHPPDMKGTVIVE